MNPRIFVLIAVLLGGMGQGVVAPKLPELLAKTEDWLVLSSGVSATLMYLGIFVSTYHYGRSADRGKVHWLLGWGLVAYCTTLVCLGAFTSPGMIMGVRFFEGLAISAVYVAADFVLGRLSKENERGQWLSYYGVALSAGLLLGPALALGSGKLALWFGLSLTAARSPFVPLGITAMIALILSIPAFTIRVPRLLAEHGPVSRLSHPALFSGAVYGFMEAGLVAVFPVLAVRELAVKPEYCLLAVVASAALSSLPWGVASDRFGAGTVARVLLALLALGTALLGAFRAALSGHATAYASCIFFGVIAGGLYPIGFAWVLEGLPASQYGFASGSFARAYGLGSLLGPLAVGGAAQVFGSRGLFFAILAVAALGLIAVYADFFSDAPATAPSRAAD